MGSPTSTTAKQAPSGSVLVSAPSFLHAGEEAPEALERLVAFAEQAGASDVHLHVTAAGADLALRLDGVLQAIGAVPGELGVRILGRIKYLGRLKTYQDRLPQDGRIAHHELKSQADVRVATYPTVAGEKVVLRLFCEATVPGLDQLGFEAPVLDRLRKSLRQPAGLLLLTGPAGSGKTTTIYACLQYIQAQQGRHIITVEDPVERLLPGIMQTEVNEAQGLGFAEATRHLLRQDPEVLVLGEIRDEATAALAVRAALTGHLVLSTLHAGSGVGVIERLLNLCPDRSAVAAALSLVLNQRLLRRSCADCRGTGCGACLHTGYRGRVVAGELLAIEPAVRSAVREGRLEGLAPERPLADVVAAFCAAGITTPAEAERILGA